MMTTLMPKLSSIKKCWKTVLLILTPILLSPLLFVAPDDPKSRCAFLVILMAVYWAIEPIPMAVTALLPIVGLPLLGLATSEEACSPYLQEPNMVFLGSLVFALAVESSLLHKRIALFILQRVGTKLDWLMLGFMSVTMFIAMWIINTAAAAMMLPITDAVLDEVLPCDDNDDSNIADEDAAVKENAINGDVEKNSIPLTGAKVNVSEKTFVNDHISRKKMRKIMYLSIAYSANIGGTSTLTSNGPNLVLTYILDTLFKGQTPVDYTSWLFFAAPSAIVSVILCWSLFKLLYLRNLTMPKESIGARNVIARKYRELGPMSFHEFAVFGLFLTLVFLWMFRDPQFVHGWATFFDPHYKPRDATVAIFVVLMLFVIPAKPLGPYPSPALVDWQTVQTKLAWGVILLRGGGFAIANATQSSGLSAFMGEQFKGINNLPLGGVVFIFSALSAFLTEFASNSATATIVLPVAAQLAFTLNVNPLMLMIPITLACSFAFILPVGTPANALVFTHAKLEPSDMLIPGLITKLICLVVMLVNLHTLGYFMFDLKEFPEWSKLAHPSVSLKMHSDPHL